MTRDIATDRHHAGHDLYVTDAAHALHPLVPRVLVRCCRCGRLRRRRHVHRHERDLSEQLLAAGDRVPTPRGRL